MMIAQTKVSQWTTAHSRVTTPALWIIVFVLQQVELILLDKYLRSSAVLVFLSANNYFVGVVFLVVWLSPYLFLAFIRLPVAYKAATIVLELWLKQKSASTALFVWLVFASLVYPISLLFICIFKLISVLTMFKPAF